ncbi:hypothetical protein [Paenibacillus oleatilyticus]|uniref:Uncharacterized protein n=1 Tax=Paenibacillus oleatilyticus TaxID=2594886 RepID=A0ABV4V5G2_9BACL
MQEPSVDFHLREALSHLDAALNKSILHVQADMSAKKEVGQQWERFLGEFFQQVREKGKQSKLNLWSWVAFPRIR